MTVPYFLLTYDAVGNRNGVTEANGDIVTWSYDEAYQLTREQRNGANAYDITFTYDGLGNRLTQVSSGATTTYSYDAANELATQEDNSGITTFSYDANGNTIGEVRPNADRVTYTWDIENHLTKVELPASVVNTITLDGDGKRRTIEDSAGLRKIVWDRENIFAETNNADATLAQYTLAPELYGTLVSQRRSGATSYHHYDALGSTNKLTDTSAATLIEYLYRAFGQQNILSGSSANPFTFLGELGYYRQPDPADYWVRANILKPGLGRWQERDAFCYRGGIGSGNCYLYVRNRPVLGQDPSGRACSKCGPEIADALKRTLDDIVIQFYNAKDTSKACRALTHYPEAVNAIDIGGMTSGSVNIKDCPQAGCNETVEVGGICHLSASVNYIAGGRAASLCDVLWVRWFELLTYALHGGLAYYIAAVAWALRGYNWSDVRNQFLTTAPARCQDNKCGKNCTEKSFSWHWTGLGDFAGE